MWWTKNLNGNFTLGPSFSGKSYLILKKVKQSHNRGIFLMTRLPEVSKDELTTEDKIGEKRESEGGKVIFNEMFDYNQKQTD